MNLTSPSEVRQLLAELDISPRKELGQNFLIDLNILRILLTAAGVSRSDRVLEIGPGLGVVTEQLLTLSERVVAVEKDRRLHAHLASHFAGVAELDLVHADLLELDIQALLREKGITCVVSNLPYSSGSRMLVELAQAETPPRAMVVTVQHEVAERLAAPPGGKNRGLLSLWVQLVYDVEIVKRISPTCFWPRPAVSSTIVRMIRNDRPPLAPEARRAFYVLTRRAFMQRRKQMATILDRWAGEEGVALLAGPPPIDGTARPEHLTIEQWRCLAAAAAGVKSIDTTPGRA